MGEPLAIPASALVVLIGAAGSGKSTFAGRNFPAESIVSSDALRRARRAQGGKGERNDVFNEVLEVIEPRLQAGVLTVVDATNTDWMRRSELIRIARLYQRSTAAIVFALPPETCLAQNAARTESVPQRLVRRQVADVERDLDRLDLEGFSSIHVFRSPDAAAGVTAIIERGPVTRAS